MTALQDLLTDARDIARTAGEFALAKRRQGVSVVATKSSSVDVVTEVDRDTETLIRRLIAERRPDDGVLGEEDETLEGTSGLTWVVDPIDGTVNFLYDIPRWCVSIAVVEGSDPAAWTTLTGAVYNPSNDELFIAARDGGAERNGETIRANADVPLDQALVGTGFGYQAERRRKQAAHLEDLIGEVRDIRRAGAAALDLCDVACGRLDAYYEWGLNPWDHAAGALIAREAGARVAGPRGGRENHDLVVAAAAGLYGPLMSALHRAGVDPLPSTAVELG